MFWSSVENRLWNILELKIGETSRCSRNQPESIFRQSVDRHQPHGVALHRRKRTSRFARGRLKPKDPPNYKTIAGRLLPSIYVLCHFFRQHTRFTHYSFTAYIFRF